MQRSLDHGHRIILIGNRLNIVVSRILYAGIFRIRSRPKRSVRLSSCFIGNFFCLALFALNAHAQYPSDPPAPPIRYNFGAQVGYYYKTYDVPTRFDLCTAWMNEENPKAPNTPIWTNPRLPPTWSGGGTSVSVSCWFTSIYGDPDQRSPGAAYCGESIAKLSPAGYVVDTVAMKCVCPQGTKYCADVDKCIKTTQLTGSNAPPAKPANNGAPPVCCGVPRPPIIGEPINPGTGNMWHVEDDFRSLAPGGLKLIRTYNSTPMNGEAFIPHSFGARWTSTYDTS
jgi:hypothetical protein